MSDALQRAQSAYATFLDDFRSVVLATVDADGKPGSSYAPVLVDDDGTMWCLVSGMTIHTRNVEATGVASALFIEDESKAQQIFARRRLSFDCKAAVLPRDHEAFAGVVARFTERFGTIAEQIAGMPDFRPLRLTPQSGNFVIGFGAAYHVQDGQLSQVTGGGQGHGGGGHGGGGHGDGGHGHGAQGGGLVHGGAEQGLTPEAVAAIVGHMNGDHGASVLTYVHAHGRLREATAARLLGLDGEGMDILATTPTGEATVRIPFPHPIGSRGEAREMLMAMARPAPGA
jgi:putative heme iron utilization protein